LLTDINSTISLRRSHLFGLPVPWWWSRQAAPKLQQPLPIDMAYMPKDFNLRWHCHEDLRSSLCNLLPSSHTRETAVDDLNTEHGRKGTSGCTERRKFQD